MTTPNASSNSLRAVLGWTVAIAAVWFFAAILRPATTLHLGPVLLPLLPAFMLRGQPDGYRGVLRGTAIGAGVVVLLLVSGNLEGPPLEPFTSVLVESFVFLAAAGAVGLFVIWLAARKA